MSGKRERLKKEVHLTEVERVLKGKFGRAMSKSEVADGELRVTLDANELPAFARFIKAEETCLFDYLSCLSGVDYPEYCEVVYHLYSMKHASKMTLRVTLPKDKPAVASATEVWLGANWYEREAAELFGITFEGHPDPRRLLLPDDFEGHPLRKEYHLDFEEWEAKP